MIFTTIIVMITIIILTVITMIAIIIRRLSIDHHDNHPHHQEIISLENEKLVLTQRERELAEQLEEDRCAAIIVIIL